MFITAFSKPKTGKNKIDITSKDAQERIHDLLQLTCHICASPYDATEKIPIIICPQQHTFCLVCVNQLFSHRPNSQRCPSCRVFVTKNATYTNKTLLRMCDIVPDLAAQYARLAEQNKRLEQQKRNIEKEFAKLKGPNHDENQNLENTEVKDVKIRMEDLQNRFPRIIDVNGSKKYSKLDIKGFIARKRLSTKENKKIQNKGNTNRDKAASVKS